MAEGKKCSPGVNDKTCFSACWQPSGNFSDPSPDVKVKLERTESPEWSDDGDDFPPCPAEDPLAIDPLAIDPLDIDPLAIDPLAMDPLAIDPLAMDPLDIKMELKSEPTEDPDEPASPECQDDPLAENLMDIKMEFKAEPTELPEELASPESQEALSAPGTSASTADVTPGWFMRQQLTTYTRPDQMKEMHWKQLNKEAGDKMDFTTTGLPEAALSRHPRWAHKFSYIPSAAHVMCIK